MKKALSVLLVLCVLTAMYSMAGCSAETTAAGEASSIVLQVDNPMMTVDGVQKEIDPGRGTVPLVVNDRTLVPVRAIVEEMGGTVAWDENTQTATLTYGSDEIRLTLDSTAAYLNGEEQTLDVAPISVNDRTMLPIRFIAESFRFDVAWDEEQQLVTITKSQQGTDPSPAPTTSPEPTQQPSESGSNALVVYFSATGNTKALAEKIAAAADADLYEIVPEDPYTSEDLNYSDDNCRANQEMNDETARPAISGSIENLADYDTIFIGYPIWWGTMPRIINTFLDTYDLSGKTVMPFCTSGSSGISSSVSAIRSICPDANVTEGFRGTASTTEAQILEWLDRNQFAVEAATRIKLATESGDIVIKLNDNSAAENLAAMLPLELDFSDFNNAEKIAYPPEEIDISDTEAGTAPKAGDLTIYAPWGNLALFYQDSSHSSSLIPLGSVESGAEYIPELEGTIQVDIY